MKQTDGPWGAPGSRMPGDWLRPRRSRPARDLAPGGRLRLILILVLFLALCVGENYVRLLWFLSVASIVAAPLSLTAPLLLGLNLLLAFFPFGCVKTLYRLLLLGLFPLMWTLFLLMDPTWRTGNQGSLWAVPLAVTAAAGAEIAIAVREKREKERQAAAALARRRREARRPVLQPEHPNRRIDGSTGRRV